MVYHLNDYVHPFWTGKVVALGSLNESHFGFSMIIFTHFIRKMAVCCETGSCIASMSHDKGVVIVLHPRS